MKITKVTVHYGRTQSLTNYNNIKPGISYEAEVEQGESPDEVRTQLLTLAQEHVHNLIDDALEADGDPPKYYDGPLFDAIKVPDEKCIVIVPVDAELPDVWQYLYSILFRKLRLPYITSQIQERYPDFDLIDCSKDLANLPNLEEFEAIEVNHPERCKDKYLLVSRSIHLIDQDLPDLWRSRWINGSCFKMTLAKFTTKMASRAEEAGLTLLDFCDGGVFSKLPELELVKDKKVKIEEEASF